MVNSLCHIAKPQLEKYDINTFSGHSRLYGVFKLVKFGMPKIPCLSNLFGIISNLAYEKKTISACLSNISFLCASKTTVVTNDNINSSKM